MISRDFLRNLASRTFHWCCKKRQEKEEACKMRQKQGWFWFWQGRTSWSTKEGDFQICWFFSEIDIILGSFKTVNKFCWIISEVLLKKVQIDFPFFFSLKTLSWVALWLGVLFYCYDLSKIILKHCPRDKENDP